MSEDKVTVEEVTVAIMQMVQYYTNHINYEMLRILHEGGHCGQFVNMCMICKQEEQEDTTIQTKLDVVDEEE